jgi:hypothetical protein
MQTLVSFKSVFKPRTAFSPWPNPKESIGTQINFPALPKRYSCWQAIGPVSKLYEEELAEAVTTYLDTCLASPTHAVFLSLCMIGKAADIAAPYIFFICKDKYTRRKAKKLVGESLIMQNERFSGFRLGESATPPDEPEEPAERHPTPIRYADGSISSKEMNNSDTAVYLSSSSDVIRPGTAIFVSGAATVLPVRATVGAVFYSGTKRYILTARHPFEPPSDEQALDCTYDGPHIPDPEDLECDFDGLSDTEEQAYTEEEEEMLSIASQSSQDGLDETDSSVYSSVARESASTSSLQIPSAADPDFHEFPQVTSTAKLKPLAPSPDIGKKAGSLLFSGSRDGLDYGLVEIMNHNMHATNRSFFGSSCLEILSVGSVKIHRSVDVRVATSSSGVLSGKLKPAPAYIRLPGSTHFEKLYIARLDGKLVMGDCGAPVVDAYGRLYGLIVGGDQGTGVAYMVPASAILADLESRHHTKVALSARSAFSIARRRTDVATHTTSMEPKSPPTELKEYTEKALIHGKFGSFVAKSKLQSFYANKERLQRLVRATTTNPSAISALLVAKIHNSYQRVFTILALIGRADYIHIFLSHGRLEDSNLPFVSDTDWPDCCKYFFEDFVSLQWQFCPLEFNRSQLFHVSIHPSMVLPIIQRVKGRDVIEIQAEYNQLSKETNLFVLKTYEESAESFVIEQIASQYSTIGLFSNNDDCKHRLRLYLTWKQDGKLFLLLEHTDMGSLEDYFRATGPPQSTEDFIAFWRSFLQLLVVLKANHQSNEAFSHIPMAPQTNDFCAPLHLIHHNFTTENIFVASGPGSSPYKVTFKLGLALERFMGLRQSEKKNIDRKKSSINMYRAPECLQYDLLSRSYPLSQLYTLDIWSLGCLLSETAVWTVDGKTGLQKYLTLRRWQTANKIVSEMGYYGCFHDGQAPLPAVFEMHKRIRGRDSHSIVHSITKLAEEMLSSPESRPNVVSLAERCKSLSHTTSTLSIEPFSGPGIHRNLFNIPKTPSPFRNLFNKRPLGLFNLISKTRDSNNLSFGRTASSTASNSTSLTLRQASKTRDNMHEGQQIRTQKEALGIKHFHMSIDEAEDLIRTHKTKKWRRGEEDSTKPSTEHFLSECSQRLKDRDTIFLIDNSSSMKSHRHEVIQVLEILASFTEHSDKDGIDLCFTNSSYQNLRWDRQKHSNPLRKVRFRGRCNMAKSFATNLKLGYERGSKAPFKRRTQALFSGRKQKKGLTLYVFTDGIWQDQPTEWQAGGFEELVQQQMKTMLINEYPHDTLSIQFISFGNNKSRIERSLESANDLIRNIVDIEPCDGNVWKMLLGSFSGGATKEYQVTDSTEIPGTRSWRDGMVF